MVLSYTYTSSPSSAATDENNANEDYSVINRNGPQQQGTSTITEIKLREAPKPKGLSIAQAKRQTSSIVKVKETVVGITPAYHMVKSVIVVCQVCGHISKEAYPMPKHKSQVKEGSKCPACNNGKGGGNNTHTG